MNKLEKYHQYVIEDIIKDTRIDYDKEKIYYSLSSPFLPQPLFFPFCSPPSPFISSFSSYVEGMYGIKDDDIQLIWKQFKQRIKEMVENEG